MVSPNPIPLHDHPPTGGRPRAREPRPVSDRNRIASALEDADDADRAVQYPQPRPRLA